MLEVVAVQKIPGSYMFLISLIIPDFLNGYSMNFLSLRFQH